MQQDLLATRQRQQVATAACCLFCMAPIVMFYIAKRLLFPLCHPILLFLNSPARTCLSPATFGQCQGGAADCDGVPGCPVSGLEPAVPESIVRMHLEGIDNIMHRWLGPAGPLNRAEDFIIICQQQNEWAVWNGKALVHLPVFTCVLYQTRASHASQKFGGG